MDPVAEIVPCLTPAAGLPAISRELAAEEPHPRPDAEPPAPDAAPQDGGYVEFTLDDDEELRAAALAAVEAAVAAERLTPPPAPAPHAIPEIARVPPPRSFARQVAVLAGMALVVGAIAVAAARPLAPAVPAAPAATRAGFASFPSPIPAPEPARLDPLPAAPAASAPARRGPSLRARPLRRVALPVEIGPAPAPARERVPAPVSAPVLEGEDADQSMREPPLTGT